MYVSFTTSTLDIDLCKKPISKIRISSARWYHIQIMDQIHQIGVLERGDMTEFGGDIIEEDYTTYYKWNYEKQVK